jgi:hypothetical protein
MRRFVLVLAGATAALLVAACGSGQPAGGSASNTNSTNTRVGVSNTAPATLTFDWLGGNSKIIQVYPGAANTAVDEVSNGTFASGQTAAIVCKTFGRWVTSVPPERSRRSNVWYKIEAGGKTYYATAVYADVHGGPINWCPGM